MNCNYINENVADLFDENIVATKKNEILKHVESCADCRETYREMNLAVSALHPAINIESGDSLKDRIIRKIEDFQNQNPVIEKKKTFIFSPVRKRMMAIAAVLIILFALIPVFNHSGWFNSDVRAGNALIKKSIAAMEGVTSVYMTFDVRTLPGDNFDYIDIHSGFVTHKLWKTFTDPPKWRIEKPGRIVAMDGKNQYMYMVNPGMALVGPTDAGFIGWMKILLDPMQILGVEKEFAEKSKAEYKVTENGNTFILTVKAKATGDFRNAYLLNSSVPESDSRRVYTFDKTTKRLLSVEIFVESGNTEYQVINIQTIRYDQDIPDATFAISLPQGLSWKQMSEVYNPKNAGMKASSANAVARIFFEACQKEDWMTADKLFPGILQGSQSDEIKKMLGGLTISYLGESFKSGDYPGEFVPYEIIFKSGEKKKFNLALRNDLNGKWMVDGGL